MQMGFLPLLTLILLTLKLTGYIAVSWFVVFAPLGMSLFIGLLVFVAAAIVASR